MSPADPAAYPSVPGPVWVLGAGSVGCYVGGCLHAAGVTVEFIGRPRVIQALQIHGLHLSDLDGGDLHIAPGALRLHEDAPGGPTPPALVLLCVKSPATAESARQLASRLPPHTLVLSLQNGLRNASLARQAAPRLHVLPAMVPFNIAELAPGHYHRGTTGQLAAQDTAALAGWAPIFERAGIPLDRHSDLKPVQWGKLLLNLNNPVNALSGLPLLAELLTPTHRRHFAALMKEALDLLKAAGIQPAQLTPLPWAVLVRVLQLPTPLFRLVAARMLRIDPKARSSMADDLALGRTTEIDALSGEVVRLATKLGLRAPLNEAMVGRIRAIPRRTQGV